MEILVEILAAFFIFASVIGLVIMYKRKDSDFKFGLVMFIVHLPIYLYVFEVF